MRKTTLAVFAAVIFAFACSESPRTPTGPASALDPGDVQVRSTTRAGGANDRLDALDGTGVLDDAEVVEAGDDAMELGAFDGPDVDATGAIILSGIWKGTQKFNGAKSDVAYTLVHAGTQVSGKRTSPVVKDFSASLTLLEKTVAGDRRTYNGTLTLTRKGHKCSPAKHTGTFTINTTKNVLVGTVTGKNTDCTSATNVFSLTKAAVTKPAPTVTSIVPSSGPAAGGTTVTISGSDFRSPSVAIGGAQATVKAATATSVTATTGSRAAGRVSVVVTNADGTVGTLTNGFEYLAAVLPPSITSISPTSGPTSGGTDVTIAGTNFRSPSVSIGNVTATVVSSSATSIAARTGARAAGVVSVVVTNSDATSDTLPNGFEYTSNGTLVAIHGGPYTNDSGREVTFSGIKSTSTPYPIAHWYWNCGQGSIHLVQCEQDSPTPKFRYKRVGNSGNVVYTVTLRVVDTQGNGSSTVSTTMTVRQTYDLISKPPK